MRSEAYRKLKAKLEASQRRMGRLRKAAGIYKQHMIEEGFDTCPRTKWAKDLDEALFESPEDAEKKE